MSLALRLDRLPAAVQRALAALGLLFCVVGAWSLVAFPAGSVVAAQDSWRMQSRTLLAKAYGAVQAEDRIRERLDTIAHLHVWDRFYPSADSARHQIRQDLSSICAAAGVKVESLAELPGSDEQGIARLNQRLSFVASAESLGNLIVGLRQHPRYLRIERLSVTSPQVQSAGVLPMLSITMEVAAFSSTATDDPASSPVAARVQPEASARPTT